MNKNIYSANILVTSRCNKNCKFCFQDREIKNDLDKSNIIKFIDFILKNKGHKGKVIINFMGGEPLIRYDLIKDIIMHYNKNKELSFGMNTNGLLLDKQICSFLSKKNVRIIISTVGRDDNKLIRTLNLLNTEKLNISFNLIVEPNTVKDMYSNYIFIFNNYSKDIYINPVRGVEWEEIKLRVYKREFMKCVKMEYSYFGRNPILNRYYFCEQGSCIFNGDLILSYDKNIYASLANTSERVKDKKILGNIEKTEILEKEFMLCEPGSEKCKDCMASCLKLVGDSKLNILMTQINKKIVERLFQNYVHNS